MLDFEQFKEMNNKLVVPAYRQFCRDNGLNFHFWDELPEQSFDLKVANREFELQKEAMALFNQMKPEFHIFQNQVVSFQFASWGGDINYSTKPFEQFFREHLELKASEQSLQQMQAILIWVVVLCLMVIFIGLSRYVCAIPGWVSYMVFPGILFAGWAASWWFCEKRPRRKQEQRRDLLQQQLARLREKINQSAVGGNTDSTAGG